MSIDPGATATLDASRFDGLVPHSSSLTLAIGPFARLDVPELLLALDRYPYGCSEQLTSRAMPLLYLNQVAQSLGMGTDDALKQRIMDAIADLMSKQTSTGGFGLWGPSDSDDDLWLDSYVTDFLLRAKKEGFDIPAQALNSALDNLGNRVSAAADFSNGGEDIAYALYDLARAGRAAIGDLRYYFEARLNNFGSPLAKAQLGAALALYGDPTRAASAFSAAVDGLKKPDDPKHYRTDYGSQLRDAAGTLALAAEFTPAGVDLNQLAQRLAGLRDLETYTSTQEDAWTLVAAAAVEHQANAGTVTIDGKPLTGTVYQRYDQEHFDRAPVVIVNNGTAPAEMKVSVTGIPATPPPATSQGLGIKREYFHLDGTRFDPKQSQVAQNDRYVVVDSVSATLLGSGQYVVADPLPAGFEIENPDLSSSAGTGDLSWLKTDTPDHVEARTDQYVATFRYSSLQAEVLDRLHGSRHLAGHLRAPRRDGRRYVPAGPASQYGCGACRGHPADAMTVSDDKAGRRASRPARSIAGVAGVFVGLVVSGALYVPMVASAAIAVGNAAADLPDVATLPVSAEVMDRNGQLLRPFTTSDGLWRLPVTPEEVDPGFIQMLVAYEDRHFEEHRGIDWVSMLRAAAQFAGAGGHIVSGGSTLTMQVARLVENERTRSLAAKIRQMVHADALEHQLSKEQILTLYLTLAPYGGNIEGIRAASLAYFGKEPGRLTTAEAALLVALPQSPEARRPDLHPAAARAARDMVLDRMAGEGIITADDAAAGKREPIPAARRDFPMLAAHLAQAAVSRGQMRAVLISLSMHASRVRWKRWPQGARRNSVPKCRSRLSSPIRRPEISWHRSVQPVCSTSRATAMST